MPRLGTLRMRRRLTSSAGLASDPQVGEDVADLPALVEARAADDLVGQADPDEHLLQRPGLGVGAVEHRDVAGPGRRPRRTRLSISSATNAPRRARCRRRSRRSARRRRRRSTASSPAVGVARDHRVGRREDGLRRAVVLLEQDLAGVGEVALELHDVADRRRRGTRRSTGRSRRRRTARPGGISPSVAGPDQLARPARTGRGWCPGTRRRGCAGTGAGSARRRRGSSPAARPSAPIRSSKSMALGAGAAGAGSPRRRRRASSRCRWRPASGTSSGSISSFFSVGDLVAAGRRAGSRLASRSRSRRHEGDQRAGSRPGRRSRRSTSCPSRSASRRRIRTQAEWNVETHIARARGPTQLVDALAHLGGGLVGERDGQDLAGPRVPGGEQVGDAAGEHAGLARAGAGDDQQRRARGARRPRAAAG